MKYKGIIFDFNGVLLWDVAWHKEVWKTHGEKLRGAPLTEEELTHKVMHHVNKEGFEFILGKEISKWESDKLTAEKEQEYRKLALTKGEEFALSPGSVALLEKLILHNIPRTIATASEVTNVDFFFKQLHLAKWFNRKLVVFDDGKLPGKPHPAMYLKAAQNLGLPPEECIAIDDSVTGLISASAAGIGKVIALGNPETYTTLLLEKKITKVISDFREFSLQEFWE